MSNQQLIDTIKEEFSQLPLDLQREPYDTIAFRAERISQQHTQLAGQDSAEHYKNLTRGR